MGSTGARLYRTDLDGAVVVSLPPGPGGSGYVVTAEHGDGHPSGAPIGPNPVATSHGHGYGHGYGHSSNHAHGSQHTSHRYPKGD